MQEEKKQTSSDLAKNMNRNPTGKGGFGDRPEDINRSGTWSSRDSISFQYKRLVKMSVEKFKQWEKDVPESDRTVAEALAYASVTRARSSRPDLQEVTDRTEGKAPQTLIHEGGFFSTEKLKIEIVDSKYETESEAETSTSDS